MLVMITCAQLAETLRGVNVAELARQTGIAEKTIYRLRHQKNAPSLGTVEKLLAGVEAMRLRAVLPEPELVDRRRSERRAPESEQAAGQGA